MIVKEAKLDHLGRVVIPIACRRALRVAAGDPLVISLDAQGQCVVIRPKRVVCRLCGADAQEGCSVPLCNACIRHVKSI